MDSYDKKSDTSISSNEDGIDVEGKESKPDYVRKIESFNVHNLDPEDIEYMYNVIGEFFVNNFPVEPELVTEISRHATMLHDEDFRAKVLEKDSDRIDDLDDLTGFYNEEDDCIYINIDFYDSPVELFLTMFHESLHFVSLGSGAGFGAYFGMPEFFQYNEEQIYYIKRGLTTVAEGTTQMLTWDSLKKMGFTDIESEGYLPEVKVMRAIYDTLPERVKEQLYFETPMEDLRVFVEETFSPEYGEAIRSGGITGVFCDCLANIGIAAENMEIALDKKDEDEKELIERDAISAVEYLKTKRRENGF